MKRNEGCESKDSILALYAKTEQGKPFPPLDGFRGIPCGFELFTNEFGGRVILLCESCAVKNGYLGASWAGSSGISRSRKTARAWIALRKWLLTFGLLGAGWMIFVLYLGSSLLLRISNYPGQLLAERARTWWAGGGISSDSVWIKVWLVVTSALEWAFVGLIVLAIVQRILQRRSKDDVQIE
jgi:hypothetical protein